VCPFLYTWLTRPSRAFLLLSLSTFGYDRFEHGRRKNILTGPCREECRATCIGHEIVSFATTARNLEGSGVRVHAPSYTVQKPQVVIQRSRSMLHEKLQSEILPDALSSFPSSVHIVRKESKQIMEIDLEAFVALSKTLKGLEEAFKFEVLTCSSIDPASIGGDQSQEMGSGWCIRRRIDLHRHRNCKLDSRA
jgi:hypothetical protein